MQKACIYALFQAQNIVGKGLRVGARNDRGAERSRPFPTVWDVGRGDEGDAGGFFAALRITRCGGKGLRGREGEGRLIHMVAF